MFVPSAGQTSQASCACAHIIATCPLTVNHGLKQKETMDPRIGWLQPEQHGPAFEMWNQVLEGTTPSNVETKLRPADFIPLSPKKCVDDVVESTTEKNKINADTNYGSKRKRYDNIGIVTTSSLEMSSHMKATPWISKEHCYPDGVIG